MNRIEEIKRKHEESVKDGEFRIFASDIQYLLTKIEIAEKALERLSTTMPGSRDNELVLHRERLALEALKAIRE